MHCFIVHFLLIVQYTTKVVHRISHATRQDSAFQGNVSAT